jgi:hypothetical protein
LISSDGENLLPTPPTNWTRALTDPEGFGKVAQRVS